MWIVEHGDPMSFTDKRARAAPRAQSATEHAINRMRPCHLCLHKHNVSFTSIIVAACLMVNAPGQLRRHMS